MRPQLFVYVCLLLLAQPALAGVELLNSGKVRVDWQDTRQLTALEELGKAVGFRVTRDPGFVPDTTRKLTLQQTTDPERLLFRLLHRSNHLVSYGADKEVLEVMMLGPEGRTVGVTPSTGSGSLVGSTSSTGTRPSVRSPSSTRSGSSGISGSEEIAYPVHELNRIQLQALINPGAPAPVSDSPRSAGEGQSEGVEGRPDLDPAVRATLAELTKKAQAQVQSLARQLQAASEQQNQEGDR